MRAMVVILEHPKQIKSLLVLSKIVSLLLTMMAPQIDVRSRTAGGGLGRTFMRPGGAGAGAVRALRVDVVSGQLQLIPCGRNTHMLRCSNDTPVVFAMFHVHAETGRVTRLVQGACTRNKELLLGSRSVCLSCILTHASITEAWLQYMLHMLDALATTAKRYNLAGVTCWYVLVVFAPAGEAALVAAALGTSSWLLPWAPPSSVLGEGHLLICIGCVCTCR